MSRMQELRLANTVRSPCSWNGARPNPDTLVLSLSESLVRQGAIYLNSILKLCFLFWQQTKTGKTLVQSECLPCLPKIEQTQFPLRRDGGILGDGVSVCIYFFIFKYLFILRERQRPCVGEGQRERERDCRAGSTQSAQSPMWGLIL